MLALEHFDLDDEENYAPSQFPRRLAEVTAWRLLTEMVRRHPGRFWIRDAWPIDGVPYDCLALCDRATLKSVLYVNRTGTGASVNTEGGPVVRWTSAWGDLVESEASTAYRSAESSDPNPFKAVEMPIRQWIWRREIDLGLMPPSNGLPASTPSSLSLRWIAQFLAVQMASEYPWYSYSGSHDLTERTADLHPHHREWQAAHSDEDRPRVWLLIRGGEDRARYALSDDGDLWTRTEHFQLSRERKSGAGMTRLLVQTIGPDLP
ncbi:hypothetical protein [Rudaeicoccus suwonensis]|uniref:T3SS peptide-binding chaperone domain-containing protein n=1 Tax=Rudaeicoccus suwonensis TaxID=657409 RepID=A0A561E4C4_9MICO|nr:hypothetical protein [Rudaeicoccus suwonensis]TWE10465.1 hypothetical protein BKA23_2827 [Rudaeicoccus suwonensis]